MPIGDFEKLGAFYLGRTYDLEGQRPGDDLLLYDAKDLTTHAVCVGMTGSGKTGLCLSLLEEAAIDGVPAILVDPKGDLSNLLLTFPNLAPADFAPWINEDDARRKGLEPAAYAAQQAELWKKGLADWGQDGARIQRLRDAADFAIYTPGSNAGLPVSILKSFDAPAPAIIDDPELFGERVASTATSLLGLLGIEANPLQSREHILLSTIFTRTWQDGRNLDLAALIQQIQLPPVARVGVMELETFFPSKDRFALAMQLNNLIASPGFSRWLDGDPLDIDAMLHTPTGRPRISILSIAHLSDPERMFFVSLLLSQMLGWARTQSGTTSLRALLYMDEIAGYFPPVANPPSKQPLLTLMKQGRAFGVGVVLATQNPVDLDYKGLANAGTWFIGRLQTDRDKQRVLDGLEGAAASATAKFDRQALDALLSRLTSRVFLMNNVHEDQPVVFETRWAMSYLRGPLTRTQIKTLTDQRRANEASAAAAPASSTTTAVTPTQSISAPASPQPNTPTAPPKPAISTAFAVPDARTQATATSARPVLPPDVAQYFIPSSAAPGTTIQYRPMLLGCAKVHYYSAKAGVDTDVPACWLAPFAAGPVALDWERAAETTITENDIKPDANPGAAFAPLPAEAGKAKSYDAWKKSFTDTLARNHRLELLRSDDFDASSKPGESERDFRARLQQLAREQRDAIAEKLRAKYAPKLATLQDRLRRAQQAVEVQKAQSSSAKFQTAVSFGAVLLSAFTGRKIASAGNIGRASTAARGASRAAKEAGDVGRAEENVEAIQTQLHEVETQFRAELEAATSNAASANQPLTTVSLKPKKTDIAVRAVVLVWAPYTSGATGEPAPAWR